MLKQSVVLSPLSSYYIHTGEAVILWLGGASSTEKKLIDSLRP